MNWQTRREPGLHREPPQRLTVPGWQRAALLATWDRAGCAVRPGRATRVATQSGYAPAANPYATINTRTPGPAGRVGGSLVWHGAAMAPVPRIPRSSDPRRARSAAAVCRSACQPAAGQRSAPPPTSSRHRGSRRAVRAVPRSGRRPDILPSSAPPAKTYVDGSNKGHYTQCIQTC